MSEKDLGEALENFEDEVENLKNKKMKLFGITMTPTTIGALFALIGSVLGALYGAFEVYKDYMDMKEIVQNIDIDEIQAANQLQLQKLEDAIGYTQSIKEDLKGDINRLETLIGRLEDQVLESENTVRILRTDVNNKMDTFEERLRLTLKDNQDVMANMRDRISTNLEESEARIKSTQASIESTLEGVRTEMNNVQKDVTASIREIEGTIRESEKDVRDTMRETESRIDNNMDILERDIKQTLQEALDNPLAGN